LFILAVIASCETKEAHLNKAQENKTTKEILQPIRHHYIYQKDKLAIRIKTGKT
jgi:hypothetical protein